MRTIGWRWAVQSSWVRHGLADSRILILVSTSTKSLVHTARQGFSGKKATAGRASDHRRRPLRPSTASTWKAPSPAFIDTINQHLSEAVAHDIAHGGQAEAEEIDAKNKNTDATDATQLILLASLSTTPGAVHGIRDYELPAVVTGVGGATNGLGSYIGPLLASSAVWAGAHLGALNTSRDIGTSLRIAILVGTVAAPVATVVRYEFASRANETALLTPPSLAFHPLVAPVFVNGEMAGILVGIVGFSR